MWQERGRQPEPQDDDEDRQTDQELHQHASAVSRLSSPTSDRSQGCLDPLLNSFSGCFQAAGGGEATATTGEPQAADSRGPAHLGNGGACVPLSSSVPGEQWSGGGRMDRSASYQLSPPSAPGLASGDADGADSMTREKSRHTLAELKRQRAAAKLNKYPAPLPSPVEEEPPAAAADSPSPVQTQPEVRSTPPTEDQQSSPSRVYFTAASGDPPLLKLRAPEEEQPNTKEPCCGLM